MEKLNWKFIAITALAAAFISVLSGLIGSVGAMSLVLRALAVLFIFALFAAAINLIAFNFLKVGESPSGDSGETDADSGGSRINIVLDEEDNPISAGAGEAGGGDSSGSLSVNASEESLSQDLGERSKQTDLEMATSIDIDNLPDLGSFSSSFSASVPEEEKKTDSGEENEYNNNASFSSGRRLSPEGIAGAIAEQNSPEDIAKAVKTVMNREETK